MRSDPGWVRAYEALLSLYPREFRDEFRDDMLELVRRQCADEPAWRVGARTLVDLGVTVPALHMEAHMNRPSQHLVPLLYTAIAGAGILLAVVGGSNITMLIVGACIAVVAGIAAVVAWRRAGPVVDTGTTGKWWWFVLAGPCIVAVVIVAAGFGVEAWFAGVVLVFLAFVLTGFGLLLAAAHFLRRRHRIAA